MKLNKFAGRPKLAPALLALLAVSAMAGNISANDKYGQTIGEAYDLESDQLLYRETHCVSSDPFAREVIYQNEEGRLIAYKILDYNTGFTTPSFVQHNLYSRELIKIVLRGNEIKMSVQGVDDPESKRTLSAQAGKDLPIVIDAGFDSFVRENWDSLVGGEKKRFLFPLVARSSLVELRIRPAACSYASETDQCFKLELSNWLFRVLAAPIELGYDAGSKRLTRYRGLSNIGDENGDGLVVDIRYNYHNLPELACRIEGHTLTDNASWQPLSRRQGQTGTL